MLKKLASQTVVYGFSSILGRLLNYLLTPILTRVFMPAEYGINTEFYVYSSFLNIILSYGMETAFFRFSNDKNYDKQRILSGAQTLLLLSTAVFCSILYFSAGPIATWLHYPDHPEFVKFFALILAFDALSVIPFAALRNQNRPIIFASIKLSGIACSVVLTVLWLLMNTKYGWNVWAPNYTGIGLVFYINAISSGLTLLLLIPYIKRFGFKWDVSLWKVMLPYALPMLIVGISAMINETFDRVLLKWWLNKPTLTEKMAEIGIYGACYKLSILMTLFVQAYRMAAEPFFFSNSDRSDAKQIYAKTMRYFVAVCSIIFIGVMTQLPWLKYFIGDNGSQYHEGLWVLPMLLLANVFSGMYINLAIWYKLSNKTSIGAIIAAIGAIITLLLNFLLIPIIGYFGSAITTLICYFSMAVISYVWGQREFPIPYNVKEAAVLISVAFILGTGHFYIFQNAPIDFAYISSSILVIGLMASLLYKRILSEKS